MVAHANYSNVFQLIAPPPKAKVGWLYFKMLHLELQKRLYNC